MNFDMWKSMSEWRKNQKSSILKSLRTKCTFLDNYTSLSDPILVLRSSIDDKGLNFLRILITVGYVIFSMNQWKKCFWGTLLPIKTTYPLSLFRWSIWPLVDSPSTGTTTRSLPDSFAFDILETEMQIGCMNHPAESPHANLTWIPLYGASLSIYAHF